MVNVKDVVIKKEKEINQDKIGLNGITHKFNLISFVLDCWLILKCYFGL